MRSIVAVFAVATAAVCAEAPDARAIVERSVSRDQLNWAKAQDYTMTERKITREFEGRKVTSVKSITRDRMFIDGEPFHRLVARDDKPLPPAEQKKEEARLQKFTSERQNETPSQRQHRLAEREKQRQKGREFVKEIPRAYDFKLAGEDRVDGHEAWIIDATPRSDFKSDLRGAWILSKFRGRIWITKQDYEWVKVDCESIDTVRLGLFLARLSKGAHVLFEQTRVNDEVWLVKHAIVRYDARLLVKHANVEEENVFSDFKKFRTDSRILQVTQQHP